VNQYYVFIQRIGGDTDQFEPVEGEPVVISGFEELDLFLHHPFENRTSELWLISEGKTGAAITGWTTTREKAQRLAQEKLEKRGLEAIRIAINKHLGKTPSPRYSSRGI